MPFARSADVDLYYETHGDAKAPTLIFAHGAGGNATVWWQQVPEFARKFRVVTFDHRCFGRSKCPPEQFHTHHFADDMRAILDAAEVERGVFVCQSMGGWTGTRFAARHPARVRALMLCNTPGAVSTPELSAAFAQAASLIRRTSLVGAAISEEFANRHPAGAFLYEQITAHNPPRPDLRSLTQDGYLSEAEVTGLRSTRIHILGSTLDPLFPPAVLEATAAKLGATIEVVEGAGHSTYFEMPARFNRSLHAFLGSLAH